MGVGDGACGVGMNTGGRSVEVDEDKDADHCVRCVAAYSIVVLRNEEPSSYQ